MRFICLIKYFVTLTNAIIFLSAQSIQAQYYVSPSGTDSNPGTLQLPFKTIQKAADIILAGETCFIMKGEYRETITPVNNGSADNPILFTNYNNEQVVILGSDTVSGWTPYQNGIYKAYMPDTVSQLFANKKRAYAARYPDLLGDDMYDESNWNKVLAEANGDAFLQGMIKPENYWVGGYCKILTGSKWVAHIGKISASNGNMVHCEERSFPWDDYNPGVYLGDGIGYIYKHLNALDKVNEWHWQNDTLYYFPESGANINTMKIEARTRLYGFDCEEKSYIEIKNIHFVWSSVNFGSATACILDGGSVWFPTPFFDYDWSWGRHKGNGSSYTIDYWNGKGIHVSGINNVVKNCYVGYSWGDGISVGGINNRVENCLVEHCNWSAIDAAAISATGYGHNIIGNTLRTSARSILVHRYCDSTNIKYNDLYDCGLMCNDLGLTYSYYTNGGGSEISYNWVHDNHAKGSSMGIYLDNYDTNYVVHHNVVWNCKYGITTNKPAVNHKIYNNTVWSCSNAQWAWGYEGTEIENQQVINNLSDKPWNVGTYFQTNLTTDSPMFVDPVNGDFRLLENSPAIDYGTNIPDITTDYIGTAPDAGAYEFGGDNWTAGSNIEIPDLSDIVIISNPEPQYLIAYYPFNGNAQDESGNGFHASEIISATLTEDKDGNPNSAYDFDGIEDKIIIPNIGLNFGQDFTITYWFQPNDLSTKQWLFGNRYTTSGEDGNGMESNIFENKLEFFGPENITLSKELSNNDWQFVAYTKDNYVLPDLYQYKLYHNGTIVDNRYSAKTLNNINPWSIGALFNQNDWKEHFNGKIDEIMIYQRSLSDDEIKDLYYGYALGIENSEINDKIIVYPNPSSSKFYFSGLNQNIARFEVFNHYGQKVFEKRDTDELDLSSFEPGTYLLILLDKNNQILLSKMIIKI